MFSAAEIFMTDEKKIHVCHLVYSFDVGGLERVIANCIGALDSKKYRHTIIALTNVGDFFSEINGAVESYSLQKKEGNDFETHLKLYKILKKIKPDVLHSYNLSTIEYQWIAFFTRIKLRVHAEHGRDSYDMLGNVKKYQILRRAMSPFIDYFISVSEDLHFWLKNDVNISEKKLSLITNGIDTDYYQRFNDSNKIHNNIDGKFIFGHVSRLHPIKNQEFLLESFELACDNSDHFRETCILIIVGDGPDRDKLNEKVAKSDTLRDRVVFTGSKQNVKDYYNVFDVFVMSSLAEGIPLTLLESMSMATPHLVTSVGGIKEVVEPDITGISLDEHEKQFLSQKMLALFENKDELNNMASNARRRIVEHYSLHKMIDSYDRIYKMACS